MGCDTSSATSITCQRHGKKRSKRLQHTATIVLVGAIRRVTGRWRAALCQTNRLGKLDLCEIWGDCLDVRACFAQHSTPSLQGLEPAVLHLHERGQHCANVPDFDTGTLPGYITGRVLFQPQLHRGIADGQPNAAGIQRARMTLKIFPAIWSSTWGSIPRTWWMWQGERSRETTCSRSGGTFWWPTPSTRRRRLESLWWRTVEEAITALWHSANCSKGCCSVRLWSSAPKRNWSIRRRWLGWFY